ncbi:lamin tail domain-containing protein, partial [Candidatus Bipolaricaulota bacterium]|nr:lamin tail domain-containing protein [Candidatus Bipolaricaulota bacterium]
MKSRIRSQGAFLVALCIVYLSLPVLGIDVTAQLTIEPSPVARGETVTIGVILENASEIVLEDATLSVPLPAGIDQWAAEVRIDGGIWTAYPANGLIKLDPIPAATQMSVDIQVPIESACSATLTVIAQLLDDTGILAAASGWVNILPSVDAGPDLVSDLDTPITLADASASDGAGLIASYLWTDFGVGGSFSDDQSLHAVYTPPASSGVIELSLTVTDADGGQSSDSLRLRVNEVPSVDIGGDLVVQEDSQISLDAAAVSDSDGWITQIHWSDGGAGGVFLASPDVMHPIYLVPEIEGCANGLIVLTLTVTDDGGATNSDMLTLHVANINELPTVYVPEDLETATGQQIDLSAIASDADGWVEEQSWTQIDGIDVDLHIGSQDQHVWFDAPDVDVPTELVFRFAARDNCGAEVWSDVMVTVLPADGADDTPVTTPPDDGSGDAPIVIPPEDGTDDVSLSDSSLSVSLDVFDERGLPMSPFDNPKAGDVVTIRVAVTNTGSSKLSDLTAFLINGSTVALHSHSLDPWSSTAGTADWVVDVNDLTERLLITATGAGTDVLGRSVTASGVFEFLGEPSGERAALSLAVTASISEAGLGEIIVYEYWLANIGLDDLVGLTLLDDQLGWIDLPTTLLRSGDEVEVNASYVVRESDLSGPLVNRASAIGFTQQGDKIEADADVSVDLLAIASGCGGGITSQQQARVVISEIAWAGSPYDSAGEWIELANIGTSPVDLAGWRLSWYEKKGTVPSMWQSIELSGVIQPLPAEAWQAVPLEFSPLDDGLWAVTDPRWPQAGLSDTGFFVMERANDDVIANVSAGLVYGNADDPYFELPDAGAAMFLINADGQVVDSANAQYLTQ